MKNINEKDTTTLSSKKDHPYMGNLSSQQIGGMAKAGQLGGEMVKRMIASVEQDMANGSIKPEDLK